jgi:hypothetical protein
MAKIDDLLQRRAKQVVLAVVARLAHGSSLTANLAVKGIMNSASRESGGFCEVALTRGRGRRL